MRGASVGKRGSAQTPCLADTSSQAPPAHSCASRVSLAIGSGLAPRSRPFMLGLPIGGSLRGPAPRRPGQPEASMAAAGASATDLGAVDFGWRERRGGLEGRMCGWGARQVPPSWVRGHATRERLRTGTLAAHTSLRSRCGGHCTQVAEPQSSPCALRVGPGQARRAVLRRGGHSAGTAALVEDHGDLPGPVALFPDQ